MKPISTTSSEAASGATCTGCDWARAAVTGRGLVRVHTDAQEHCEGEGHVVEVTTTVTRTYAPVRS